MKKLLKVLKKVKHPFIVNGTSCATGTAAHSCNIQGNTPYG